VTDPPLLNIADFEKAAEQRLPRPTFDYYAGGAADEVTLRESRAAYERIPLYYRVLRGIDQRSLETTVLNERVSMPVLVAPTAFHRLAHDDGELATVRAAGAAGTIMIVSTMSNTSIEDITRAATGPVWFQLYIYRDRRATQDLVARVEAAGCRALVLTVDAPLIGPRERDLRNQFTLPEGLTVRNLLGAGHGEMAATADGSGLHAYVTKFIDPTIAWADVEWLRSITRLPLVIKGIARADDARRAVDAGARAIVVSNHGGRQLDTSPATIDALPPIAEAVAGRAEIYIDGGVRRGTDVIKAIARGARAVLIGRPILWGLAVDGEPGARRVLDIFRSELDIALGLCGHTNLDEIGPDLLRP
jgi:4-hydroxymandelate oxidase